MDTTTATGIATLVSSRKASAMQVMREYLGRTVRLEPLLNTYSHLDAEGEMRQAEAVDNRIAAGQAVGPMAGVAFRQLVVIDHAADRFAFDLWG